MNKKSYGDKYTKEYMAKEKLIEQANEIIKTKITYNFAVYKDGETVQDGFEHRYDAIKYMDSVFFVGTREKLEGIISPIDFGYDIVLISKKTEILNIDEVENVLGEKFIS